MVAVALSKQARPRLRLKFKICNTLIPLYKNDANP